MSKHKSDSDLSKKKNVERPDYFGYHRCQIAEILSQDDGFIQSEPKIYKNVGNEYHSKVPDSMFSNGIQSGFSDLKRERLKAALRQSVTTLSTEVDKIFSTVMKTRKLRLQRREKLLFLRVNGEKESGESAGPACKKLKVTLKNSACSDAGETDGRDKPKVNDEVEGLLENDDAFIDNIISRMSEDLSSKLEYMEKQLEELLDDVTSKYRLMTAAERIHLKSMIRGLPRKNLEHIAEVVERNKPVKGRSSQEISVDLEKERNGTLWRMYNYIEAVERAKQLRTLDM